MVSLLFVGLALIFCIIGHKERFWQWSIAGMLVWLIVFFWWLEVGITPLFGMTGRYIDIVVYLPLLMTFFTLADLISYWNTVEIRNRGKDGRQWTTFGGVPKYDMPNSYESYKEELQRRLGRRK